MKFALSIVLFLLGMVFTVAGLYMIHPGLMIAVIGAFTIRHALTLDERSRDEA